MIFPSISRSFDGMQTDLNSSTPLPPSLTEDNSVQVKATPSVQVKHKQRVADHGEVFTSEREVNAMLDLVKNETDRIESRFLEPACGNGNFLAEILTRKLAVVEQRYKNSQLEYERYAVTAISSLYGVDLLEDNVEECRQRLLGIFLDNYRRLYKDACTDACIASVTFILSRNILWGDALTLKTADGTDTPIIFSEWSAVNGSFLKRRDFAFSTLLAYQPIEGPNLFSDLGESAFIAKPVKDYPLMHFLKLDEHA